VCTAYERHVLTHVHSVCAGRADKKPRDDEITKPDKIRALTRAIFRALRDYRLSRGFCSLERAAISAAPLRAVKFVSLTHGARLVN